MVRWLALAFLIVPLVELWLLLRVGDVIGFWPTMAFVVGTAFLGAYLAKREGLRVFTSWRSAIREGRMPDEGITSGLLVLVGATLLVSPGVLTDVFGMALLVPPVRRVVARLVEQRLVSRFITRRGGFGETFSVRVVVPPGAGASGYGVARPRAETPRPNPRVLDVEGKLVDER